MRKNTFSRRLKYSILAAKIDLFGDMDIFDFGNIVMACTAVSTLASLALYAFCVYCI
jgi:hypothetical protein